MEMTESDQLQPEDTLVDRGIDDILDEGISPPEKLRGSTAKGVTAREALERESIDERLQQEEPDDAVDADPSRTGRLVAPDAGLGEDTEKDAVAIDVGIDGGAASAEEAAVHLMGQSMGHETTESD